MTAGPIAYTLFCDDVRHEEGNKYSAMGVYVATLELEAETQVISKFIAMTMLELPLAETGKHGRIRLMDGDRALVDSMIEIASPPEEMRSELTRFMAALPIEVSPFSATSGMRLRVTFELGSFSYESDILDVQYNPQHWRSAIPS